MGCTQMHGASILLQTPFPRASSPTLESEIVHYRSLTRTIQVLSEALGLLPIFRSLPVLREHPRLGIQVPFKHQNCRTVEGNLLTLGSIWGVQLRRRRLHQWRRWWFLRARQCASASLGLYVVFGWLVLRCPCSRFVRRSARRLDDNADGHCTSSTCSVSIVLHDKKLQVLTFDQTTKQYPGHTNRRRIYRHMGSSLGSVYRQHCGIQHHLLGYCSQRLQFCYRCSIQEQSWSDYRPANWQKLPCGPGHLECKRARAAIPGAQRHSRRWYPISAC